MNVDRFLQSEIIATPLSGDLTPRQTTTLKINTVFSYKGIFDTASDLPTFAEGTDSIEAALKLFNSDGLRKSKEGELISLPNTPETYIQIISSMRNSSRKMKRKRFLICRHGETEPNNQKVLQGSGIDESLNERGVLQAKSLAEALKSFDINLIVSSDLKRAKETASYIHSKSEHYSQNNILLSQDPRIQEISWGIWEGTRDPDMSLLLRSWEMRDFEASPPEGESPADCVRRAIPVFDELCKSSADIILIVAHGRLLRIILAELLHKKLDHMSLFHHHNTSLNVLDAFFPESDLEAIPHNDIHWIPLLLDDCSHVPEELRNT